jgi:Spy/CpxP family protein refolding chaperone
MGNAKLVAASLLALGAAGFFYVRYSHTKPPAPAGREFADPGAPGELGRGIRGPGGMRGPMSPEQRGQFREQMLQSVNATPEQRARIQEIEKQYEGKTGPEAWRGRMDAVSQVLTPEQQAQARQAGMERMRQRMNERLKVLPPGERQKFIQKLEARIAQRGGMRFGPFQGGRPGPGRPGPGRS